MNEIEFCDEVRRQLRAEGYEVHQGDPLEADDATSRQRFTWMKAGAGGPAARPTTASEWGAWAAALDHRLAEGMSAPQAHGEPSPTPMGPFFPASLPDSALDPDLLAERLDITREAAQYQVDKLRRQAIYMNERYQVNVGVIPAPFGPDNGDMFWLSIKRRDREVIRDWRELQAIKNRIVGDEHEGFEVYPAESRLVDSANQFHLWVFADPTVRLPVGFRAREVLDAQAAATQGARQRPFASKPPGQSPAGGGN